MEIEENVGEFGQNGRRKYNLLSKKIGAAFINNLNTDLVQLPSARENLVVS